MYIFEAHEHTKKALRVVEETTDVSSNKSFVQLLMSLIALTGEKPGNLISSWTEYGKHHDCLLVFHLNGRVTKKDLSCDVDIILGAIELLRKREVTGKIQSLNKSMYVESVGIFGYPYRLSDLKTIYNFSLQPTCGLCNDDGRGMYIEDSYIPCPGCSDFYP